MTEACTNRLDGCIDSALDWNFLQCFGERTPGEEVQEGPLLAIIIPLLAF